MLSLVYRRGRRNAFLVFAFAGFSVFLGFAPRQATVPAALLLAVFFSLALVYLMKGSLWLMRLSPGKRAKIRSYAVYFAPVLFLLVPLRLLSGVFPILSSTACLLCVMVFVFALSGKLKKGAGLPEFEIAKFWAAPFLLAVFLCALLFLGFLSNLLRDFS